MFSIVVGASPTPLAGQDAHGAVQSSYQLTDGEPGNARGTPEPYRQVNARAARPIPARVKSVRRSEAIIDWVIPPITRPEAAVPRHYDRIDIIVQIEPAQRERRRLTARLPLDFNGLPEQDRS